MNFVGDNIRKHIIVNTDAWTAVREETKKELYEEIQNKVKELKKDIATWEDIPPYDFFEEMGVRNLEIQRLIKRYEKLKDKEV